MMMKNALKSLGFFTLLGTLIFITSCGKDDGGGIIIDDDGGSFAVADGLYLAGVSGSDTTVVSGNKLSAAKVEADGFGTQDRSGHQAVYTYLEAGSYLFVDIKDQNITDVYGGSASEYNDDNDGNTDDYTGGYTVVDLSGSASTFNVAEAGLYHVSFDALTDEALVVKVESWGVIGGAVFSDACTSDGFNADVNLEAEVSVTAEGASYKGTGIILKDAEFKLRYNDNWKIDRRTDKSSFDEANGYVALTNLGGTPAALEEGGANIGLSDNGIENGIYDITFSIDANGIPSLSLSKTGDAPVCEFNPDNYKWGILGSAVDGDDADNSNTPDGWEMADRNMYYKGNIDGKHTWFGVVVFEGTDGAFKIRANDDWTTNLGGTLSADGTESTLDLNGSDIANPGSGMYFITVTTADQGSTWNATMVNNGWALTGAATPNGWADDDPTNDPTGVDHDFTGVGTSEGITTYTLTLDMTSGEYKIRANDAWDYNLGGDMNSLTADGNNLSIAEAGTYNFTLSYDGDVYSITATKQ